MDQSGPFRFILFYFGPFRSANHSGHSWVTKYRWQKLLSSRGSEFGGEHGTRARGACKPMVTSRGNDIAMPLHCLPPSSHPRGFGRHAILSRMFLPPQEHCADARLYGGRAPHGHKLFRHYHWTEDYYIINSETILDADDYITFSKIHFKQLM